MSTVPTGTANVLLTDLYELTMLQAYFEQRMNATAVFAFFVRKHPAAELARLPDRLRALEDAAPYPVEVAPALRRLASEIDART